MCRAALKLSQTVGRRHRGETRKWKKTSETYLYQAQTLLLPWGALSASTGRDLSALLARRTACKARFFICMFVCERGEMLQLFGVLSNVDASVSEEEEKWEIRNQSAVLGH